MKRAAIVFVYAVLFMASWFYASTREVGFLIIQQPLLFIAGALYAHKGDDK